MKRSTEHDDPMERFVSVLSKRGLKLTRQRRAIAEVFFASGKHLGLNEILELARERHGSVGYATVYRTMRFMADAGLAEAHDFGDAGLLYEPAGMVDHHDHLICVHCGRIVEFENAEIERLQLAVAREHGFSVVDHRLEIYGTCSRSECQNAAAVATSESRE